jgi:hypothetical protein
MFPSSNKGGAVIAFPSVCKVPAPPAPWVPATLPGGGGAGTVAKEKTATKVTGTQVGSSSYKASMGDEAGTLKGMASGVGGGTGGVVLSTGTVALSTGTVLSHQGMPAINFTVVMPDVSPRALRDRLNHLHGQMITLPGANPDRWHVLLDEYVQTMAQLYVSLSPT